MKRLITLPGSQLTKPEIIDESIHRFLKEMSLYKQTVEYEGIFTDLFESILFIGIFFEFMLAWLYVWFEVWNNCKEMFIPTPTLACVYSDYETTDSKVYNYKLLCFHGDLLKPGIYYLECMNLKEN